MQVDYSTNAQEFLSTNEYASRIDDLRTAMFKKADGGFTSPEDFLSLPFSDYSSTSGLILQPYDHIVFIGIGGSSLGPKAVYDALFGYFDIVSPARLPKVHFLENVDKAYIDALMASIKGKRVAVVVACKSGKTYETNKNLAYLYSKYQNVINPNAVFVVATEGNAMWEWGRVNGAKLLKIPASVSGRFQVFAVYNLVMIKLCGLDDQAFLAGAREAIERFMDGSSDYYKHMCGFRYSFFRNNFLSDVYFVFDGRLKSLVEGAVSITAESLGKPGGGIFPVANVGSRDCHSTLQLYVEGPKDKFTYFLSLSGTDADNTATLVAVKKAYNELHIPFVHYVLDSSSQQKLLRELGEYMQAKIIETVLLGGLMGVNPYNQPGVELYKKYLVAA